MNKNKLIKKLESMPNLSVFIFAWDNVEPKKIKDINVWEIFYEEADEDWLNWNPVIFLEI